MTVYADEAFLLNGAVDYLLLICAAKLGGGRIARLRLLAAAVFGGLYAAAALFAPLGVLQALPMKLVSLAVMLLIAFGISRETAAEPASQTSNPRDVRPNIMPNDSLTKRRSGGT